MVGEREDVNTSLLTTPEVMTAADVMTAAPHTCSAFSTVLEAVMIFREETAARSRSWRMVSLSPS